MKNVIILEEVTSTNEYLKQYYKQLPSGAVVSAYKQTSGKGRLSRTWKSEKGNLYMSVLKRDIDRETIFEELMNVSVSIVRLLKEYGVQSFIKYPNDIIVGKKKISGILIESMGYEVLEYLIIGVGLNINQFYFDEISHKATSIFIETGRTEEVDKVRKRLLLLLQEDKDVYKEYITHSYVIGKQIYYQGMPYIVSGINLDGSIKLKGNKEMSVPLNEITLEELYE